MTTELSKLDLERKPSVEMIETAEEADEKVAQEEIFEITVEENNRVRWKIDKKILPILFFVYMLQIVDKFVFGYANIYGMSADLGLKGTDYSLAATMNKIAQLAWMPFSTYLVVKVPARILMPAMMFCWGASCAGMAGANSFGTLAATRFLLGLFEAGCLPLFSAITAHWYRRSEQPFRIALWYCTVGFGQITSAILAFALGKVHSHIASWRIIFLIVGLITVVASPIVWLTLDSDIPSARFLNEDERKIAMERVRANQNAKRTNEFKFRQIVELVWDPKTWLFGGLAMTANFTETVATSFGPTLLKDLGFKKEIASLLNAPFGGLQVITILLGAYLAQKFRMKGPSLLIMMTPVFLGTILLYVANSQKEVNVSLALGGYYLLSGLWSANPLVISWMVSNTGGQTKLSGILSAFNLFNAAGSIVGPLLFNSADAPRYLPGLKGTMGVIAAFMGCNLCCFALLFLLNKRQERKRVAVGKPAKIHDTSMVTNYENYYRESGLGEFANEDVTDFKNNEFVYVY